MVPFVSNAQFFELYDYRWVGKQILDDNTAASLADMLDSPTVSPPYGGSQAGRRIYFFLTQASEMVMSAAAIGDRYNTQTNPALPPIANDLALYGGTFLIQLVCDLAIGSILKRRARAAKDDNALTLAYTNALESLEQLRQGERIFFQVPGVPEAGLPTTAPLSPAPGFGPRLISDNCRIFGNIGWNRNYGINGGPGCGGC